MHSTNDDTKHPTSFLILKVHGIIVGRGYLLLITRLFSTLYMNLLHEFNEKEIVRILASMETPPFTANAC
jgi:hypothetical protein